MHCGSECKSEVYLASGKYEELHGRLEDVDLCFSSPPFYTPEKQKKGEQRYRNREQYTNCEPDYKKFMTGCLIPITQLLLNKGVPTAWYIYPHMAQDLAAAEDVGPWRRVLRFK